VWEEKQVTEYVSLSTIFVVQVNIEDMWIWNFDRKKVYSIKGVYYILKYHNLR
jgi:hypothetical protein